MKLEKKWLLLVLAIICVFGSILLSYEDKEGWGWLIFIAVLSVYGYCEDEFP